MSSTLLHQHLSLSSHLWAIWTEILYNVDGDSEQPEFANGSISLVCEGKWTNMKRWEDFGWYGGDTHPAQGAVVGSRTALARKVSEGGADPGRGRHQHLSPAFQV